MRVKILGRIWQLVFRPRMGDTRGVCDAPDTRGKQIRIAAGLRGQERLEVLIHELTHAAYWHMDEEFVEQYATDLARTLWRLGYRDPLSKERT